MPILLFPHAAYILLETYRPNTDPLTGLTTNQPTGQHKWVKCDLSDPAQRERAHEFFVSLGAGVSEGDRVVGSDWADVRRACEVEEERERRIREMVVESEGVAGCIERAEERVRAAGGVGEGGEGEEGEEMDGGGEETDVGGEEADTRGEETDAGGEETDVDGDSGGQETDVVMEE
ncbi:hypothetical protein IMSHALPRED_001740 [Imshaugia aleurites]|uniref:Uncharacterized protein n=1 Tax=Imshaugia aleurites TaxID=172621 RepID=A0A8H3J3J8_9LECA|nr:hypothetical protein IMSHALPRED_001740 [Imshaugia aleurites]